MKMTLQELSEELRMYAGRPEGIHVDPSAFSVWADAIDASLYHPQPKPVAQGEAGRDFGSVPPRWYTQQEIEHCLQRMSYSEPVIAELAPWFHRHIKSAFDKGYNMALGHATPTIPTGHRVVPVGGVTLREAAEEALDLLEHVDPEHGITTQLRCVLAAAPDAGGV